MTQPTIDGLQLNASTSVGSVLGGDTVASKFWQAMLVGYSTGDGSASIVMADTGLPVTPATGATWSVTGTFWQATQPVSAASLPLPSGASTSALQSTGNTSLATIAGAVSGTEMQVDVVSMPTTTVTGTVAATQSGTWNIGTVATITNPVTVSGTVTANAGTGTFAVSAAALPLPSGASTAANQSTANGYLQTIAGSVSGGHIQVDVVSGGGAGEQYADATAVSAAYKGNLVLGTDGSNYQVLATDADGHIQVDVLSAPTTTVTGTVGVSGSVAVTGTFWQATQPVSLASVPSHEVTNAGTFAVQVTSAPSTVVTATNLDIRDLTSASDSVAAVCTNAGTFAVQAAQSGTWNITNVSGTVSLPTGAATAAKQPALGTAGTPSSDVLSVQGVVGGAAVPVSGTFYQATQPVSGAVTANAGTNLNTSALALESGGNLAAAVTALQLIDNAVSGSGFNVTQFAGAAVPIGAGLEATALRVTLATDSTGVVSIDDNGGAITVDGTVAATQSGTWNVGTVTTITNVVHVDDNAGSLTVDGTVTANLSATDNAVLDDIAAKLATIDADTSALFGTVGGTELQVDVVAALPAGTNAIGKLAANSGVDIGDVDVTSIAAGTNTIGGVIAQQSSSIAYDGTTACTVKRFHSANPSDGDSLIAAVADKKFRVLSFGIISISGTICRFWLDDADAAAVFGNSTGFPLEEDSGAAAPGFILNHNPHGWFQTATANKALRIQFASGSGVVVFGTYIEVA